MYNIPMSLNNLSLKKKKKDNKEENRKKEIKKTSNIIEEINKLIKIITTKSEELKRCLERKKLPLSELILPEFM